MCVCVNINTLFRFFHQNRLGADTPVAMNMLDPAIRFYVPFSTEKNPDLEKWQNPGLGGTGKLQDGLKIGSKEMLK